MNIKVGLFGGSGKMGKAIEQMLPLMKSKNKLVPFLYIGKDTSDLFSISAEKITNVEEDILKDVDVWIEFTSPEGLSQLLKATEKFKTPVVSGSTGLSEKDFSNLKKTSSKRKLFWASNMSPGLWAFRQAMKGLSHISNFDFAIEEIHHTQKKDNPSGTAKTLHRDLEKIINKKVQLQQGLRIGGVFGVHTLSAASSNEMITMQHQALNRTVFAEGALLACEWLVSQKSGLYSMDDMFLNK
jgi:4-hydroxy-tetrahydrodipicolinate reductase